MAMLETAQNSKIWSLEILEVNVTEKEKKNAGLLDHCK
jgi:hypothetical protein